MSGSCGGRVCPDLLESLEEHEVILTDMLMESTAITFIPNPAYKNYNPAWSASMPVQRRGRLASRSTTVLPLAHNSASGRRRGDKDGGSRKLGLLDRSSPRRWALIISLAVSAALLLRALKIFQHTEPTSESSSPPPSPPHPNHHRKAQHTGAEHSYQVRHQAEPGYSEHHRPPLAKFTHLKFALEHSKIVLLYFAASWCPMSTPVSVLLDKVFGSNNLVLGPEDTSPEDRTGKTLSIVYVSSDSDQEEYDSYLVGRNWLSVPFSSGQRADLKRHFATCAHRELKELGIDRKQEIPTIIVLDGRSQGVLTTAGVDDLDRLGAGAMDHWLDLQKSVYRRERLRD